MKSTFKKMLSILIVACMLVSAVPFAVSAADTTVSTWADLTSAVASASSGDVITLGADVTATAPIQISGNVKINGGKTITRSSSCAEHVFIVSGTLTLENVTVNGNRTSTATADLAKALIFVNQGATLNLNNGAVLTTNRADATVGGAGVFVSGGTLNMAAGSEIKDMHHHNAGGSGTANVGPAVTLSSGSFTMNGGMIRYCDGRVGAVSILGGTFTMNGGEIYGCIANNQGLGGAGVHNAGTFTMNGGSIHDNTSWTTGGGVYNLGTFNLIDGTITNNNVTLQGSTTCDGAGIWSSGTLSILGGQITNNIAQNSAGGVMVAGGTATMSAGTISGNTTSTYSGGGVFVAGSGSFAMTGGSIINNTATQYGGAIAVTSNAATPINVTGGKILGNTCGANQCGADIYVTTAGNVAATTLGSGCVVDRLYLDNQGSRYSASNAQLAPSANLTANYGYIYVTGGTEHTFGDWVITVEAGCETTGTKVRTCSVCGTEETATIPAKGHNTVSETVNPTCTVNGYRRFYCPVCGVEHSREILPATGHIAGKWIVTTEATASAAGTKAKYCTSCGALVTSASYTVNDPIVKVTMSEPAELDDDFNTVTATVSIENNPGLFALGTYFFYDPAFTVVSASNGDVFDSSIALVGATDLVVAEDPEAADAFAVCGVETAGRKAVSYYAESAGLENTYTNGTLFTVTFKYDAELEDTYSFGFAFDPNSVIDYDGENVNVLFKDEDVLIQPIIICDHVAGGWTVTLAPTCTETGTRVKTCTICGRVLEREVIPATGHTPGNWVITVQPGVNEGERVKYCTACGTVLETEVLRPTQRINVYANDVTAANGGTVDVDLYIENNTGLYGIRIFLYYPEAISVSSVTNGVVFNTEDIEIGDLNINPYTNYIAAEIFQRMGVTDTGIAATCIYFEVPGYENNTSNGKLATVTFSVPSGLVGDYVVHVMCDDAIDSSLNDISVNCYDVTLTAVDCLHENTAWAVTAEPTCTEPGVRSLVCSNCGTVLDTEAIPANGHTFAAEWTVDVEPTATTPGSESRHCLYCDAVTDVREIPPTSPILLGDVNDDGKINAKDIALLKRFISGLVADNELNLVNGDVNGDGKHNARDITAIKRFIALGEF